MDFIKDLLGIIDFLVLDHFVDVHFALIALLYLTIINLVLVIKNIVISFRQCYRPLYQIHQDYLKSHPMVLQNYSFYFLFILFCYHFDLKFYQISL